MKEFLVAILIVIVVLAVVFGPMAVIWSVNTLFNLTIPYTFKTWAASFCLSSLLAARVNINSK